jgi:hypothetical protein
MAKFGLLYLARTGDDDHEIDANAFAHDHLPSMAGL